MEPFAQTQLQTGDDFLPVFLRETAAYAPWIDARKQDLTSYRWDGGPIEILFVDAAKSWELTNAIFRGFGPFLEPGRSRIVLQDFRYYETHWLPLIFDSRPDLWQEVEDVDEGHTVTFTPLRSLAGPGGIEAGYSEETFPLERTAQLLRDRISREGPSKAHWYLRMLYRKYLVEGSEETQKLREQLQALGTSAAELAQVEELDHLLVPRGWKAFDAGNFDAAAATARRALSLSSKRSVHTLTLLGFSLLRMGHTDEARRVIDEVLLQEPLHTTGRLFRAEMAIIEARYFDAEQETLGVLRGGAADEGTIEYGLDLLSQIWSADPSQLPHVGTLESLEDSLRNSPSFQASLAREQQKAGVTPKA